MRTSITSVQLAILETKRERFKAAVVLQDQIHREAAELLAIDPDRDGMYDDFLSDFLNDLGTTEDLVDSLGLNVHGATGTQAVSG